MVWQKANVPECVSPAIQASSGKPCNPELTLDQEIVLYIGDSTILYLVLPSPSRTQVH